MTISQQGIDFDVAMEVACHEALIREAYKDSVGVWTWSVGLTSATGHRVERYIGKPQSLQHCLNIYVWALKRYAAQVEDAFTGHRLTKEQFAAAVSFHWNTGAIKRALWVKMWKSGDVAGARDAFMYWTKPSEVEDRRRKERDLFFDGKWANDDTVTEYDVNASGTPAWSTARRIKIGDELSQAFETTPGPFLDHESQPDKKPAAPTLSPGETGRNYKGRFQGTNWSESIQKPKGNFVMFAYNKFLIAIAGFILTFITNWTGLDFQALGLTPEMIVSGVTAVLVWAVPNLDGLGRI